MNAENEKVILGQISQRISQLNDILYTGCVIGCQVIQQNNMADINNLANQLINVSLKNRIIAFTNIYTKIISKCNWQHVNQKRNLIANINQNLLDYFNVLQANPNIQLDKVTI